MHKAIGIKTLIFLPTHIRTQSDSVCSLHKIEVKDLLILAGQHVRLDDKSFANPTPLTFLEGFQFDSCVLRLNHTVRFHSRYL